MYNRKQLNKNSSPSTGGLPDGSDLHKILLSVHNTRHPDNQLHTVSNSTLTRIKKTYRIQTKRNYKRITHNQARNVTNKIQSNTFEHNDHTTTNNNTNNQLPVYTDPAGQSMISSTYHNNVQPSYHNTQYQHH